ncbi:hypothetical protein [Thaumasiovibrio sp. DFM-14]|uniref:hypothetical protein n=1 Tax=Thaumasiovibrio sp. DFM-14 TaxID=3384792 RepID=UPI0039A166F7
MNLSKSVSLKHQQPGTPLGSGLRVYWKKVVNWLKQLDEYDRQAKAMRREDRLNSHNEQCNK